MRYRGCKFLVASLILAALVGCEITQTQDSGGTGTVESPGTTSTGTSGRTAPAPAPVPAPAPTRAPNAAVFAGTWQDRNTDLMKIVQEGTSVYMTATKGGLMSWAPKGRGKIIGDSIELELLQPNGTRRDYLKGKVIDEGTGIQWSNGSLWLLAIPGPLEGRWRDGNGDTLEFTQQQTSIFMKARSGGLKQWAPTGRGTIDALHIRLELLKPDGSQRDVLTGIWGGGGNTIQWSNGGRWQRM